MTFIIFLVVLAIAIFVIVYRSNRKTNAYKFINQKVGYIYEKYTPYSFRVIRDKVKELGQEYTPRQYAIQIIVFAASAAILTYLYFYNIAVSLIYAALSIVVIPYLTYLRCKRVYSEFIFEQIQVYTTNTIMEFQTTQSFVKALEQQRLPGAEYPCSSGAACPGAGAYPPHPSQRPGHRDTGHFCRTAAVQNRRSGT